MSRTHVDHSHIVRFADDYVNLKRDDAKDLREQVGRLRDRLEEYIKQHPDFELKKMLLSGSLAKGTALKSLNDIDVACYVSAGTAPATIPELIQFLAERLRNAFPNFKHEQVKPNTYSVTVTFIGSGLRVDVVPILYHGDPQWKGYLVSQDTGEKLLTSIPMHLAFTKKRKDTHKIHFAQVVRLLKFWIQQQKIENDQFRFKSFMAELLVAHLTDGGLNLSDYPDALAEIFAYLAKTDFKCLIAFPDYYSKGTCKPNSDAIQIWDPVNCENNVAKLYTATQRSTIVEAALDAGDAVDSALRATTKGETIRYWQKLFGPSFNP
jgi:tRNA nucleotidyltransferase (CCA-adding enzyme)